MTNPSGFYTDKQGRVRPVFRSSNRSSMNASNSSIDEIKNIKREQTIRNDSNFLRQRMGLEELSVKELLPGQYGLQGRWAVYQGTIPQHGYLDEHDLKALKERKYDIYEITGKGTIVLWKKVGY